MILTGRCRCVARLISLCDTWVGERSLCMAQVGVQLSLPPVGPVAPMLSNPRRSDKVSLTVVSPPGFSPTYYAQCSSRNYYSVLFTENNSFRAHLVEALHGPIVLLPPATPIWASSTTRGILPVTPVGACPAATTFTLYNSNRGKTRCCWCSHR